MKFGELSKVHHFFEFQGWRKNMCVKKYGNFDDYFRAKFVGQFYIMWGEPWFKILWNTETKGISYAFLDSQNCSWCSWGYYNLQESNTFNIYYLIQ